MTAPRPARLRRLLRFRSRPLRSRLAILTAAAVAVAVAACAAACWFVVRGQLLSQLDQSLKSVDSVRELVERSVEETGGQCLSSPPSAGSDSRRFPFVDTNKASVQLVFASGQRCWVQGDRMVPVTSVDKEVAAAPGITAPDTLLPDGGLTGAAPQARTGRLHTVTASDGAEFRVYTMSADFPVNGQTVAVSIARPLRQVTQPLDSLALVLVMVTGIGVLGSMLAGLWVARAGLKPVDRFTATVEHIARTEDLTVRIPVDGEDEIARLSESFNSMTARLAASRDLQQQLIADAGHELRTPLTSMRTNIELLERSELTGRALLPQDRRELLVSVKAQMGELASLIGDLQELSRPEGDPGGGPLQTIAFHEVVEAALDRARLRGQGVKVTADVAPWYVRSEPAALERAVINLLDNAIKFSPPGGTVEVGLHEGELTVRDHGPGIAPEELPHVFERFWRSTSARSLPGSGLGLSIVARTVQQAGGTVALHPAPDGGTTAVIRLPGSPAPHGEPV